MLSGLLLFSLKSSVVLCVLYTAYHFLFRKNTHFHVKRIILLLIIGSSLALPQLKYESSHELASESPAINKLDGLRALEHKKYQASPVTKVPATTTEAPMEDETSLNWLEILGAIYVTGVVVMLSLFIVELVRLSWILGKGRARHDLNRMAVTHRLVKFPFSFWRWIFLPADLSYDQQTWELIQEHENVHLKQGHTLDILFATVIRCLLWFNPAAYYLQQSIKDNHEALADRMVLTQYDLSRYSKALLEVCLQTGSLNLGHAFALKSNLSKRINTMNLSNTHLAKSLLAILIFATISLGLFTQTSLYAQHVTPKSPDDSALEMLESGSLTFVLKGKNKLTLRHQRVFDKLKSLHSDKELSFTYLETNEILEYLEQYNPYQETLYFDKIGNQDKNDIWNQLEKAGKEENEVRINGQWFNLLDFSENFKASIDDKLNYLVIYHRKSNYWDHEEDQVYEMYEVDQLPEPVGGINRFTRSVALDMTLPEGIDKSDLPETVDFEFVVHGGGVLSHINLLTELQGDSEKTKAIYQFFGKIHNNIRGKTGTVYKWKKGIKDGQAVKVRMVISIPTKYM
jgi:beta-lactamase regulating signal transducer with metallopeptidase domain